MPPFPLGHPTPTPTPDGGGTVIPLLEMEEEKNTNYITSKFSFFYLMDYIESTFIILYSNYLFCEQLMQ
jgi:hypothetical protein